MRFGVGHLTDVLAGRETDKVLNFGHHRLSVFGIADEDELALVKPVARALLARDALRADDFGGLSFGPGAKPILKGEEKVEIVLPPKRDAAPRPQAAQDYPHDPLFEALRARRRELAAEAGVPPYVIFHDSHPARDGRAEAGHAPRAGARLAASAPPSSSAMARPSSK